MKLFRELVLSRVGTAALVTGGSASLPAEMDVVLARYPDATIISANQHGVLAKRRDVDFLVCYDNIHGILREAAEKHGIEKWPPILTYHPISDYRLLEYPVWPMSGQLACWVAVALGCCPIILTGMGCYGGDVTYFHDPDFPSDGRKSEVEVHVGHWRRVAKALGSARIRVVDGPLVGEVFPRFDPAEDFSDYVLPDRLTLIQQQTGKVVKITRPCRIGADCFEPDMVVELPRKDAQSLFEKRRAVPARASN